MRLSIRKLLCQSWLLVVFSHAPVAVAQSAAGERPVVAEGVVPDQASKQLILDRLRALYGAGRVVDRVQVEDLPAPPNWGHYVAAMLADDLRQVSPGKLEVNGQAVKISGQVQNEAQRQQIASELSLASNAAYTVTNALRAVPGAQQVLDRTLANRIIEFQSGSAQLTAQGMQILDEMIATMVHLPGARFLIVGHTDNVGLRENNLLLSQARARAVKDYLARKGIAAAQMDVIGKGPDVPVADNATAEGRARNRRIEFRIE